MYCLFFLWNTDTCRSHSGLCLMKYLQAMCSCLLGANLSGAIYPPEQAAEEMQAETADAGLEMWRYGKCEEYCTHGKTRFDMRVNQVVLYCSRHKYRKQISNIFLTLKQSSCSMKYISRQNFHGDISHFFRVKVILGFVTKMWKLLVFAGEHF